MPAMPPPERPCGRTSEAGKCSSWATVADEAQRLLAGGELDGADDLVAVLEADHLPLVAAEHLGVDPLDDAVAGAERQPGPVGGQRAQRQRPLAGAPARASR